MKTLFKNLLFIIFLFNVLSVNALQLGKISVNSPIARALIGKEAGDVAEVDAPGGIREYEILTVQYI